MHTEPIVWLAAQSDLQCALFSLTSLLLLSIYADRGAALALLGAATAFALALLSKEAALPLPGMALLLLLLFHRDLGRPRIALAATSYALVLGAYLALRFHLFGRMGGYNVGHTFWNTWFPSAPLRQLTDFLFPVNQALWTAARGRPAAVAAIALMGAAAIWWARGIRGVPSRRLLFWLGWLFIMSAPIWMIGVYPGGDLGNARLGYLPTVSLAWLFGDICAGGRCRRFADKAVVAAVLAASVALSVWYVTPWKQAAGLRDKLLLSTTRVVFELPPSPPPRTLFIRGVPPNRQGAHVFENGFDLALAPLLPRPVTMVLAIRSGRPPFIAEEALAASVLLSGEYELLWRRDAETMTVVQSGSAILDLSSEAGQ